MSGSTGKRTAIVMPSERPKDRKPRLVVIAGPDLGRQIDVQDGDISIGRDETAVVRIDSDQVSRRHASIQRFGSRFVIADLGSTNGTFVNEQKVRTHRLAEGDQIKIGKVVLKYTESGIEAEYHQQILSRANVDALTGAYNKRYFEEEAQKVVTAARGAPVSLVLFDIDHFKKINDTYGHAGGDLVLKELAAVVRAQIRDIDVLCRVGGEEFAIIVPGAALATTQRAAEFVRGAIEMTGFVFDGKRIPVTASFGVAEAEAGEPVVSLYKRADERLYEAKRSGRNRVS